MLMAKSGRKKHFSFSFLRWRQQAEKERRFCIIWINRMVNKQVEKRITELQSEFLLMNRELRKEVLAALHEQLVGEETKERSVYHNKLEREKRETSRWLREMEEDYKDNFKEDEDDEENSVDLGRLSLTPSEIFYDTNSTFEMRSMIDVSNDAETSQFVKELAGHEEESSKSHAKLCFGMEEQRGLEEGSIQVDRTKEEEALLIVKEWKEWMDKQEMKVTLKQVKPSDQQNSEKQGVTPLPVSEKQMMQNVKGVKTMKKFKTYLNDVFMPHSSKWERFEDED